VWNSQWQGNGFLLANAHIPVRSLRRVAGFTQQVLVEVHDKAVGSFSGNRPRLVFCSGRGASYRHNDIPLFSRIS